MWILGLGASWIWNNKKESLILGYIFYRNPMLGAKLIRLSTVETTRYGARMTWGLGKVLAPEATKKIESRLRKVRSSRLPEWAETGSKWAKRTFVGSIIGTGFGMVEEQFAKAERGDYGGETTMSQFITDADTDTSNPGRAPEVRLVPMGGPGGGLVF